MKNCLLPLSKLLLYTVAHLILCSYHLEDHHFQSLDLSIKTSSGVASKNDQYAIVVCLNSLLREVQKENQLCWEKLACLKTCWKNSACLPNNMLKNFMFHGNALIFIWLSLFIVDFLRHVIFIAVVDIKIHKRAKTSVVGKQTIILRSS